MNDFSHAKLEEIEKKKIGEESDGYEIENLLRNEEGKYYTLSESSCSFDLSEV